MSEAEGTASSTYGSTIPSLSTVEPVAPNVAAAPDRSDVAGDAPLAQRRDVETLSAGELSRFRRGVAQLQATPGPRGFEFLAGIYGLPRLLAPHHKPTFLTWHRAFLLHFELALRANDPGVALPWWNFTANPVGIPDAFTLLAIGNDANALFTAAVPETVRAVARSPSRIGYRTVRMPASQQGVGLPTGKDVDSLLGLDDFVTFQDELEALHDRVHLWVGGTSAEATVAAYDPLFYCLQANIDRIFWLWQERLPGALPADSTPMPPFDLSVGDVVDIRRLGYTYVDGTAAAPTSPEDSAILAGYRPDTARGEDFLGVTHEVAALCSVLLARDIEPPISVGLFGEWGSGKSFFMEQMRSWTREASRRSRAAEADERLTLLCSHVKQVTFNAWHYTDANLWASLMVRLFEGLGEPDTDELADKQALHEAKRQRDQLIKQLPIFQEQLREAENQKKAISKDLMLAKAKLASITSTLETKKNQLDAAQEPDEASIQRAGEEVAHEAMAQIGAALPGATIGEDLDSLRRLESDLSFTGKRVRLALGFAWDRPRGRAALLACGTAALLLLGVGVWLLAAGTLGGAIALYATIAPLAIGGFTTVRNGLNHVQQCATKTAEAIRQADQRQVEERRRQASEAAKAQQAIQFEVQRLAANEATLLAEVHKAESSLADVGADLDALDPQRRLSQFIEQRTKGGDYAKYLGVIALIRRDFEELDRLMRRARARTAAANADEAASDGEALQPIDRIILYIDDLDRVSAPRVVEVLQAVHLLLAMPLFVVVVAVDPRWLLKSLQNHYAAMLEGSEKAGPDRPASADEWSAQAFNYLEKIFQIPFTLDPMPASGYQRLVANLMASPPTIPEVAVTEGAPARDETTAGDQMRGQGADFVIPIGPARAAVDAARALAIEYDVAPRSLEIDAREVAFMQRLAPMIPTPRGAKRLANTYRLIRAAVRGPELDLFLKPGAEGGQFQAVLVLLALLVGYPDRAPDIFLRIRDAEVRNWDELVRSIKPLTALDFAAQGQPLRLDRFGRQLDALSEAAGPEGSLEPFRLWLTRVARYSFQAGRALQANPPPQRKR